MFSMGKGRVEKNWGLLSGYAAGRAGQTCQPTRGRVGFKNSLAHGFPKSAIDFPKLVGCAVSVLKLNRPSGLFDQGLYL